MGVFKYRNKIIAQKSVYRIIFILISPGAYKKIYDKQGIKIINHRRKIVRNEITIN
jgi:hypothetical protein